MINIFFMIFTYLTEALIVFIFANKIYNPKKNFKVSLLFILALYVVLFLQYQLITNNEFVNMFLIFTVNFLILYLLYESSIKSALFQSATLLILQLISEFLAAYIIAFILHVTSQTIIEEHFESGTIMSRIIYLLLSMLLAKVSLRETRSKSWGRWFSLSLLPISSIFIIAVFKALTDNLNLSSVQNIISISSISLLLLVNIFIYVIYERAEGTNQKLIELEITNQKNSIDLQYLSLLELKNDKMQIMAHDYKNHIQTIEAMTDSPEIKEYLHSLIGEITEYNNVIKTKNRILDVIISKYSDICSNKNIKFTVETISENLMFFSGNDLSALLNNILDNAVEAAEKSTGKYVSLLISQSMKAFHTITILNSCDVMPQTKKGKLISTKNSSFHGFGTKSIEKIVDKYRGELQWEYDMALKEFKLIIAIPIQ